MNENRKDDPLITYFTPNILRAGYWFGKPRRNWIEAALVLLIFIVIMMGIPFVTSVRNVIIICIGGPLFEFFVRGICNRSVFQMIKAEFRYQRNRRILHLRGPEFKQSRQNLGKYMGGEDEEIFDRIGNFIKEHLLKIAYEWGEEEDGKDDKGQS